MKRAACLSNDNDDTRSIKRQKRTKSLLDEILERATNVNVVNMYNNGEVINDTSVNGRMFACSEEIKQVQNSHPDDVILFQIGSFYESQGRSALVTSEVTGLRLMGNPMVCRAGTPISGIQRIIDSLIEEDLVVRLYVEESTNHARKKRVLKQVLSRSNPYFFDESSYSSESEESYRETLPCLLLFNDEMYLLNIAQQTYQRTKEEVTECFILYYTVESCSSVMMTTFKRKKQMNTLQSLEECIDEISKEHNVELKTKDCVIIERNHLTHSFLCQTGFIRDKKLAIDNTMPDITKCTLGPANNCIKSMFHRWITMIHTTEERDAMRALVNDIDTGKLVVPKKSTVPVLSDRIIAAAKNGSLNSINNVVKLLLKCCREYKPNKNVEIVMRALIGGDIGSGCDELEKELNDIIISNDDEKNVKESLPLFADNETFLLGLTTEQQNQIDELKKNILQETDKNKNIVYMFDTLVWKHKGKNFTDHKGKLHRNYTSSDELQRLVTDYKVLCNNIVDDQIQKVNEFGKRIADNKTITSQMCVVVDSVFVIQGIHRHLVTVKPKGFCVASDYNSNDKCIQCIDMFPPWMTRKTSTNNTLNISAEKVTVLTAPNSTGKTSLLRTIAINTVMSNSGLYVSASEFRVSQYDFIEIRLPASDDTINNRSSFAVEMHDFATIATRIVNSSNSLVLLDEVAHATSATESLAISRAIIEYMQTKKITTIFSTHIHELLEDLKTIDKLTIDYDFNVRVGSCNSSNALRVCKEQKIPASIIDRANELLTMKDKNNVRKEKEQEEEEEEEQKSIFERSIEIASTILNIEKPTIVNCDEEIPPCVLNADATIYIIETNDESVYIGESKNVIVRRKQHDVRDATRKDTRMAIFCVDNKTESLINESLIIQTCMAKNINLQSVVDGNHFI